MGDWGGGGGWGTKTGEGGGILRLFVGVKNAAKGKLCPKERQQNDSASSSNEKKYV